MKRSVPKTRWSLLGILVVASFLTYAGYIYFFTPKQADIFVIEPQSLQYGKTTLSGTVQKDTTATQKGNYLLVTESGKGILLDIPNLDLLIGKKVIVKGTLVPPSETIDVPIMLVAEIVTQGNQ